MNEPEEEFGDPVCWLDLVCPECGRVREDRSLAACAYCGTPVDEDAGPEHPRPQDGSRPR